MSSHYTNPKNHFNAIMVFCILIAFLLLFTPACETVKETIHGRVYGDVPLVEKTLKPRKGFDGKLTWRRCLKYEYQKCVEEHIATYDLTDEQTRKNLNSLNFRCRMNSKRWKICLDKPGLCHFYDCKKKTFWRKRRECKEEFLEVTTNYQFLLDAGLKCEATI